MKHLIILILSALILSVLACASQPRQSNSRIISQKMGDSGREHSTQQRTQYVPEFVTEHHSNIALSIMHGVKPEEIFGWRKTKLNNGFHYSYVGRSINAIIRASYTFEPISEVLAKWREAATYEYKLIDSRTFLSESTGIIVHNMVLDAGDSTTCIITLFERDNVSWEILTLAQKN